MVIEMLADVQSDIIFCFWYVLSPLFELIIIETFSNVVGHDAMITGKLTRITRLCSWCNDVSLLNRVSNKHDECNVSGCLNILLLAMTNVSILFIGPRTCSHSQRLVAIMCIRPNLARAACLAKLRLLLLRNIKCIWAVTSNSLAPGVIALNGPEAISAPICNPVNTNEPAPNPTAPSLRQKLPYCCVWGKKDFFLHLYIVRALRGWMRLVNQNVPDCSRIHTLDEKCFRTNYSMAESV